MELIFSISINKYKVLAIFWNTILALAPCITVYYLSLSVKSKKWVKLKAGDKISFILLFLFWLLLFPNTAYLFTIVRHLVNYCHDFDSNRVCMEGTMWLVMFFYTYAFIGIPTFYYALKKMSSVVGGLFSKSFESVLPVIVIPLTSLALMFGLFERFNSWDILMKPWSLIETTIKYFTHPIEFFNFIIFTICLYLIYYGIDYFIHLRLKD